MKMMKKMMKKMKMKMKMKMKLGGRMRTNKILEEMKK